MKRLKKRDGRFEDFNETKITEGLKKAGASAEEAARVTKEVASKLMKRTEVAAEELSNMVVSSMKKVNSAAADEFVRYRDKKLRVKKKKE